MSKHTKFSPEVRDRAIRMVYEVRESHTSQWAAIEAVASKIGCTAQTLSSWIRKAAAPAAPSASATDARVKELEQCYMKGWPSQCLANMVLSKKYYKHCHWRALAVVDFFGK
mgnify:CR=1 FL=1